MWQALQVFPRRVASFLWPLYCSVVLSHLMTRPSSQKSSAEKLRRIQFARCLSPPLSLSLRSNCCWLAPKLCRKVTKSKRGETGEKGKGWLNLKIFSITSWCIVFVKITVLYECHFTWFFVSFSSSIHNPESYIEPISVQFPFSGKHPIHLYYSALP